MTGHLSSDQIVTWLAGGASEEELQHGRDCPQCSAEAARLTETLSVFRSSVRHWADRENSPDDASLRLHRPQGLFARPVQWAVAFVLAFLLTVPLLRHWNGRVREADAARDAARLLEEVDAHIARTVPAPMEPLLNLLPAADSDGENDGGLR